MFYYISTRIIDGKPRKIIVDEDENIINKSPSKDELQLLTVFPAKRNKRIYTDKQLLNYLRQFYKETGTVPIVADFDRNSKYPSIGTYVKYFGSLNNAIEVAGLRAYRYNETNSCSRCGRNFDEIGWEHPMKEIDRQEKWTKEWICSTCWNRDYDKNNHNSRSNAIKSIANIRTNNQNPNHNNTKGDNCQELACKLYGWEDLNKKNDNYTTGTPIDCYDPMTGLYHQIRGRSYNSMYRCWNFATLEDDWNKEYESAVCYCMSKNGKITERIYIIPSWEIIGRKSIGIYKYCSNGWYEKYRVIDEDELKKANDIWKILLAKIK